MQIFVKQRPPCRPGPITAKMPDALQTRLDPGRIPDESWKMVEDWRRTAVASKLKLKKVKLKKKKVEVESSQMAVESGPVVASGRWVAAVGGPQEGGGMFRASKANPAEAAD